MTPTQLALPLAFMAFSVAAAGCTADRSPSTTRTPAPAAQMPTPPADPCTSQAGFAGTVVGSFSTTIGAIRAVSVVGTHSWPNLPDSHPAVLCYIDGPVAKAPPPVPSGPTPRLFDRAVIVIIDGQPEFLAAGYRESLPIETP